MSTLHVPGTSTGAGVGDGGAVVATADGVALAVAVGVGLAELASGIGLVNITPGRDARLAVSADGVSPPATPPATSSAAATAAPVSFLWPRAHATACAPAI